MTSPESSSEQNADQLVKKSTEESRLPKLLKESPRKFYKQDGSFNDDEFYALIGNDIRRKILLKLSKFPRYASDLAIDLGVSKQAVKKHLDRLEEFGLVEKSESGENQKKQYYQINSNMALFCKMDITPNYFGLEIVNDPEAMVDRYKVHMDHNPETTLILSRGRTREYTQFGHSLKTLGAQLQKIEQTISQIEEQRRIFLLDKTVLLNRIQMIMNSMVEDDLEKEVIFSLFFDTQNTVEGLTLEEILNQLFIRKKKRAGVSKYKYQKTDHKTIERGQELLKLLQMLIENFGFIRTDENRLFFDFSPKKG